jgi:SAM-dependent methyltransferase
MDAYRKIMQKEWTNNSRKYRSSIGMTGRKPNEKEFSAVVKDISSKFDLHSSTINRLLDVGCNNAYLLNCLNPQARDLFGIDFCSESLHEARKLMPNLNVLHAEICKLPFIENSFDRVLCYNMFHYLPSQNVALEAASELFRVLSPGGAMLIGDLFVEECKNRIPQSLMDYWNSHDRPFMHRPENWFFVSLEALTTFFHNKKASDVRVYEQAGEIRCSGFRRDLVVFK